MKFGTHEIGMFGVMDTEISPMTYLSPEVKKVNNLTLNGIIYYHICFSFSPRHIQVKVAVSSCYYC